MRTAKFRLRWNVAEQFLMTAAVQNIKRFVKLMDKKKKKIDTARAILDKIDGLYRIYELLSEDFHKIHNNINQIFEIKILIPELT